MSDNCNNNCNNENNGMKPIPFVVYGYPMYGMYPGGMMQSQFGGMNFGSCGNYMNPVYVTPYNNRHGCCTPTDLDK